MTSPPVFSPFHSPHSLLCALFLPFSTRTLHTHRAHARAHISCYLPNGTLPMLPKSIQEYMGLGLAANSPALSIGEHQ